MPPLLGKNFRVKVGANVVSSMNQFSKDVDRGVDEFPVFDQETPYTVAGKRGQNFSFGGLYQPDDAGQNALLAAELANSTINISVLWDGTNGFSQDVNITAISYSTTPEGFQEITFECSATADAVIVGTGPIL